MIRKIHLDFHTHPNTPGIGLNFDAGAFADTLASANVNYVATPGKCHFGNIYYRSRIGHSHPNLCDPEMFPATVAACNARGIKVQSYWTLGLDAHVAVQRPEWRQRFQDGSYGRWGHYLHICFASPYVDEVVIPEVLECIERCPGLAGFWFDICLYVDGAFYSQDFCRAARERLGDRSDDIHARWSLAREIIRERCIQIDRAIKTKLPDCRNYFNSLAAPGEPQNLPLQPLQEVENPVLFGSPEKMTANVRWFRGNNAPVIGLVSRFQGPWSDPGTLRTADQMRFDVARCVALGCQVSMGDHRYPDGSLEPEVYRRLAPIYEDVKRLEPWLEDAKPCREAVLLSPIAAGSGKGLLFPDMPQYTLHAARLLEEIGVQFDVLSTEAELPADCGVVVLPGGEPASAELLARLKEHVSRGGSLLAMAAAVDTPGAGEFFGVNVLPYKPMSTADGNAADMSSIGHVGGSSEEANACGATEQFMRLMPEFGGESFSHILTLPTRLIEALDGVDVIAERYEPVSSKPPFASREPAGPMAVRKGNVIYAAPSLFAEAAENGSPGYRNIINALLDSLLPERLVRHSGGTSLAAHLHKTKAGYVLHLLHWAIERWGGKINPVAEFPILGEIDVSLRIPDGVTSVTLEPSGEPLEFLWEEGVCTFTLPRLRIWQAVGVSGERFEMRA